MKKIDKLLAVCLLIGSGAANASTTSPAYITDITVQNGIVVFNQAGNRTAPPACQGSTVPKRWSFSGMSADGQVMMSLLMSAYSLHKQVFIAGQNACNAWPDSEAIAYMIME